LSPLGGLTTHPSSNTVELLFAGTRQLLKFTFAGPGMGVFLKKLKGFWL